MRNTLLLLVLCILALPGSAEKVTLYRDTWGVPHVYAATERGAAYGQGYAAAEDRLEAILRNYLESTGHMAEAFGPKWIEHDFMQRRVQHEHMSRTKYREETPEVRVVLEAYVAGLTRFMRENPSNIPAWTPAWLQNPEPWLPIALSRYVIFSWPMGEAVRELGRRVTEKRAAAVLPELLAASNQWAVSPSRTADGAAILMIDPHLSFSGVVRFHEIRMHGGDLHLSGTSVAGMPLIGLGHNRHLGWAATTGGPDTTDVYEEELNPANPLQYRYDGQWRDVRVEKISIPVKTDSGTRTEERELRHTHHGPIVLVDGSRAYSVRTPYMDQIALTSARYKQAKARNLEEFKAAMAMNQWMQQNIMYADVEGNIFYVRTGRVPIRPDGYDWSKPVPGNTSATEWRGIHPMKDLVQALNPADGFMQNCNADPMTMMVNPPWKPTDFPAYIYNSVPYAYNPRAERSRETLQNQRRMTLADAIGVALDTVVDGAPRYLATLSAAAEAAAENPQTAAKLNGLRRPLQLVMAWDGRVESHSVGATIFDAWLAEAARAGLSGDDRTLIRKGETLSPAKQSLLLDALGRAAAALQAKHGTLEVPWGKLRRIVRGPHSFPTAGGPAGGIRSLRDMVYAAPNDAGEFNATGGQTMPTLVIFRKTGAESWSALPWGNSDDPASPHFADQAEKLVSRKTLKPSWFEKRQLMPHVASEKVLEMQP